MIKAILAAGAISLAAATSAFAASPVTPAAAAVAQIGEGHVIDVRNHDRRRVHPRHRTQRYSPGRRYSRAPRGWRRYAARPGNWGTRGCILVGPVWFCP